MFSTWYGNVKDLFKITASNKVLHDKAFNIAKNAKFEGCQRGLASLVHNFFDRKSKGGTMNNKTISSNQ